MALDEPSLFARWRWVGLAGLFYLFLASLGVGLLLLWGLEEEALRLARGERPLVEQFALGIAVGLGVVALSLLSLRHIPLVRELELKLALVIGPVGWGRALVLALLSGVAEEFFFRIALLPRLGRFWSSLLFAAMHVGRGRAFLLWTATAAVLGALFAVLVLAGWGLACVATAHFLINAINLARMGRLARRIREARRIRSEAEEG